jgi:hypothetical protein
VPVVTSPDRVRVAVVSTPRSGNTWLRGLLAQLTGSVEIAVHTPAEVPWETLPPRVLLQIHWYPTPQFTGLLNKGGFKVVTISRHPLDVLISILHFCRHEPATARWLEGRGGTEESLLGATPLDLATAEYAASRRFRELLGVTDAWWDEADAAVRYEDLVADPVETLRRLASHLGLAAGEREVDAAIESRRLDVMRPTTTNQHYWQGTPGGGSAYCRQPWRRRLLLMSRPTSPAAAMS